MSVIGPSIPVYDYYPDAPPCLVGILAGAVEATIEVWDAEDGSVVTLTEDACNAIGDTGKFSWSTQNMPAPAKTRKQYHYRMSGGGKTDEGDFIIQVIQGLQQMPSLLDEDTYLEKF